MLSHELNHIADNAANTIKDFIFGKINQMNDLSSLVGLSSLDKKSQESMLSKLLGANPPIRQVLLIDETGKEVIRVSRISEELSSKLLKYNKTEVLNECNKGFYISDIYIDEITNEPMVVLAVPVKNMIGQLVGALIAETNLKFAWNIVYNLRIGRSGVAYVVDKEGRLIAFKDVSRVLKGERLSFLDEVKEFMEESKPAEDTIETKTGILGQHVVTTHTSIAGTNWALIVEFPYFEAYEEILKSVEYSLISLLLGIALALFLGFYAARRIVKPIVSLRNVALEIGKGNFDVKISVESENEIGELAKTIKNMARDLKLSQEKIKDYSRNLEKKVAERTKELEDANKKLLEYQKLLERDVEELKKLDIEKDRFISIAAHELKTPMTAISGFAQLLKNEKIIEDKEKREKYLKIVEEEIKRLAKLVTDVLDLSRADLGTIKVFVEDVNVEEVLNEVKEEMSNLAKEKGLYLNLRLPEKLPTISTDREKLKRILINLVSNAIKYTEKGGVTIEAVKDGDKVKFSVADTGVGIPKESFDKIFTRFYQVESPYTRKVGGTGLGLSICKELVKVLGGEIWFESELGKGSTFYFTLPLKYKSFEDK